MSTKKFISKENLEVFKEELDSSFATKIEVEEKQDAITFNPTIPVGVVPAPLSALKSDEDYYKIPEGSHVIELYANTGSARAGTLSAADLAILQATPEKIVIINEYDGYVYYFTDKYHSKASSYYYSTINFGEPYNRSNYLHVNYIEINKTTGDYYRIVYKTVSCVQANPTLSGAEPALTSLQVGGSKYKIPTGVNPVIEITWSDLKTLRDGGNLNPGQLYRITDYTCTTTQSSTSSAGHVFDIIVRADSTNILNESARAALHSGDTYFANNKLEAWELKYCLDNDANRFAWADTTNGKGVIYYMKDEWNNEIPYDFKNILMSYGSVSQVYTFTIIVNGVIIDLSIDQRRDGNVNSKPACYNNIILPYFTYYQISNGTLWKQTINKTIFCSTSAVLNVFENYIGANSYENVIKNFYRNTIGKYFNRNTITYEVTGSTFGNNCSNNTISDLMNCTIGNNFSYNTVGDYVQNNIIGNNCYHCSFGYQFAHNVIGSLCQYCTFGTLPTTITNTENRGWVQNLIVDNNCQYLNIYSNEAGNNNNKLNYLHIHSGILGTASEYKNIIVSRNLAYTTDVYASGSTEMFI